MRAIEYASPQTKEQAVRLLASQWGETEVLAGGTDLISLMKDYVVTPKRVVSLKHLRELKTIESRDRGTGEGLRVGAMVTFQELADHADVRRQFPALVAAAEGVTSPQIRNMGTVGGDLLQRPRCWYYRLGYGLLAQFEGKPLVPEGDNRYHAILGNSGPAYFVSPSSLAPILIAFGATVRLFGPQGAREVALEKFYTTPQNAQEREYVLQPNEILTDILVPPSEGARAAVYEVRQKEALDWPLAAAAVALRMDGDSVNSARVVLSHVAPVPWRSPEAEQALTGKAVNEETAAEAGQAAVGNASPLSKNGYKVKLASVAVKRALLKAGRGEA